MKLRALIPTILISTSLVVASFSASALTFINSNTNSFTSNNKYLNTAITSIDSTNTSIVSIGSEKITIPKPSGFEEANLKDINAIRILLNPFPNPGELVLATFKSESNQVTDDKRFIRVINFTPFNKKYVKEKDFAEFKVMLGKAKSMMNEMLKNPKLKEGMSILEDKLGVKYKNFSFLGEFVNQSNALGLASSIDMSLKSSPSIKVDTASIILNLKGKIMAVQVFNISENQGNIEWVKRESKEIAAQIIGLNNGQIKINQRDEPHKDTDNNLTVDYIEELKKIKELFDTGVINEKEFKLIKQRLINKL